MDSIRYGAGACNSCHDYDTVSNDWGKQQKAVEGWGAHALHINHLKALSGVTLDPDEVGAFGGANYNAVCGVCHTKDSGNHAMGGSPIRSINFGDGSTAYQFSTGETLTYNGAPGVSSATTPKTCSNVNCHFQPAPAWQGY
jgi:hypothetical protein